MNHLLRSLAPLSDDGWRLLDEEARERLQPALAARRVVDFSGPHGWEHAASNLGRTSSVQTPFGEGVTALQRRVLPLVELRVPFALARQELRDADRGAQDADLEPLDRAATQMARSENAAVFHGFSEAAIVGVAEASSHEPLSLDEAADAWPRPVACAVERLLDCGVGGPYGLVLGGSEYRRVVETAERGGVLLLDHLRKILEGPVVWAPGVNGAIVLSMRGGDFLFESGQDLSIGYEAHDAEVVRLYLEESFSFRVLTAEAAVALRR